MSDYKGGVGGGCREGGGNVGFMSSELATLVFMLNLHMPVPSCQDETFFFFGWRYDDIYRIQKAEAIRACDPTLLKRSIFGMRRALNAILACFGGFQGDLVEIGIAIWM
ncbi:hypothetical protein L6452_17531 [Arctium lappa]|uniref:Uncharacterized protein n=1 Tax=Arctium lappa TaxID=4217 RepID=A0ACB9C3N2_ARCLA|nr:hypothetical protein L6452_17531 [Arctium lappa]